MAATGFIQVYEHLMRSMMFDKSYGMVKERFARATTDAARVTITYEQLYSRSLLPFDGEGDIYTGGKSPMAAEALLKAGARLFVPKPESTHACYTRAIALAPYPLEAGDDSKQLARAFASRSAILFHRKNYHGCLSDIGQALTFDYTKGLVYKLLERQGKCYQIMRYMKSASESFKAAREALKMATSLPKEKLTSEDEALNKLYTESCESDDQYEFSENIREVTKTALPRHEYYSCASNAITLKHDPVKGRYVEATRSILPGEILVVEQPFTVAPWPCRIETHCNHCMIRFSAMIPCKTCHLAVYCSENCRNASWEKSHKLECNWLAYIFDLDCSQETHSVLRALLIGISQSNGVVNHYKYIRELEINHVTGDKINGNVNQYEISDIYFLERHTEKRSFEELLKNCTMAACLLNCLVLHSDIFKFQEKVVEQGKYVNFEKFVGGLILRYTHILACNGLTAVDILSEKKINNFRIQKTARALYPFMSWMNNSCTPNVVTRFEEGKTITVMAWQPIKKGQEIYVQYWQTYSTVVKETRKEKLRKFYFFNCDCLACHESWPIFHHVVRDPEYLCSKCSSPLKVNSASNVKKASCPRCNKTNDIVLIEKNLLHATLRVDTICRDLTYYNIPECAHELAQQMSVLYENTKYPNYNAQKCQEAMKLFFNQSGNLYFTL